MARVIRTLIYDGPEDWIKRTMECSLPLGLTKIGKQDATVFVTEHSQVPDYAKEDSLWSVTEAKV